MKSLYSIGEFSRITGLSIKTLRFYHEKGLLVPASVDEATGYRSYDARTIDKARIVMRLRKMEFSLEDTSAILSECSDDAEILNYLAQQKDKLQQRIREDRDIVRSLSEIIAHETAAKRMLEGEAYAVAEKVVEPQLVAGVRMKGKYSDCGAGFSRLGKAVGRYIGGKALCLYYDGEYREEDADFEPCFPVRRQAAAEGISFRTLPGGKFLTLIHRGPYDQLGRSYARIMAQAEERKLNITLPTREVFVKGPGMFFKGNPKNYLTEIQLPVGS
jgi:DNA-binding transcriptional MerR regulator/effector-binding domain-containing protein